MSVAITNLEGKQTNDLLLETISSGEQLVKQEIKAILRSQRSRNGRKNNLA